MDKTFLTVKELAAKLGVSEKTVYRMINDKAIPFVIKIGGQWRFNSEKVEKWILASQPGGHVQGQTNYKVKIVDALANGQIIYRTHGKNRDEVLDEILGMLPGLADNEAIEIKKHILYKESIISSSLQGLSFMVPNTEALPQLEKSLLLIAFLEEPMDFKAIDQVETEVVFLLLAANKTEQLILQTRLKRLFMEAEFISLIKQQLNRRELVEKIADIENKLLN
ncbi:PTS IIA-like nitrogen-regulatory protein PtsN [Malonomonas rubra DSM 5091]|uniref:PTS IIA-like nitrogen-regulatory protein PtsN n=1 Tax=Malonomonas rubra DSM 5091 TaxID=1122189 RepID=A0A1M6E0H2_MALRU|nr:helix-turn-helix domain-containing protein [Malonomonas rubra]SHI78951.1 PTS IIA-like nitrogen-regulatory protein PtsN [Malonomonas rubra DSM 5091]